MSSWLSWLWLHIRTFSIVDRQICPNYVRMLDRGNSWITPSRDCSWRLYISLTPLFHCLTASCRLVMPWWQSFAEPSFFLPYRVKNSNCDETHTGKPILWYTVGWSWSWINFSMCTGLQAAVAPQNPRFCRIVMIIIGSSQVLDKRRSLKLT